MRLFLSPHACSLAADIVAREAGIPLQLEWVDVRAKKLADGSDYFSVNPKGQVPTLQMDDGQFVTEGAVIVQLLADSQPGSLLLPSALGMDRYRVLEWLSFISSELHKGYTPLFRPNTPAEYRAISIENLNKRLAWLDTVLAGRDYLNGVRFTVADAYCYTVVSWSHVHRLDLSDWRNLTAYLARVEQRPSVQAALAAERAELDRRAAA
ncbi:MAG: glutathione transferase GstA [Burkholderiales bacterium]